MVRSLFTGSVFSDSHHEIGPQFYQTVNVVLQKQDLEKEMKNEAKGKRPTMSEVARHGLMQPRSRPSAILSDFRSFLDDGSFGDGRDGAAVSGTVSFVPVRPVWLRLKVTLSDLQIIQPMGVFFFPGAVVVVAGGHPSYLPAALWGK